MGDQETATAFLENARISLERRLPEGTVDPRLRIALGLTYAGLGRRGDAVREGLAAVEAPQVANDAFIGPQYVEHLAAIYVMTGDLDAALERIEYLLSIPSKLSVPILELDPKWDPLRGEPRFKALIAAEAREAA